MIARLIRWSIANRFLVLLATVAARGRRRVGGAAARRSTRFPTCPTRRSSSAPTYPGQAPQIVEDQVTYPLTTTMLSVPGAKTVRGYSFFGDSFVYVLFDDGTDLYWARSRVLEYLNQVQGRLPARREAVARAGCDRRRLDLRIRARRSHAASTTSAQLRALQDWFLKYELKTVPNVAEVATRRRHGARSTRSCSIRSGCAAYGMPHARRSIAAIRGREPESGGSVLELGEAEYMVRVERLPAVARRLPQRSRVKVERWRARPCCSAMSRASSSDPRCAAASPSSTARAKSSAASSCCARARTRWTPSQAVKAKLERAASRACRRAWRSSPTYDRSALIERAVEQPARTSSSRSSSSSRWSASLFLLHLRSALVAVVSLPLGVLAAFIVMRCQGVNANIMSLGGIAIAIGAMVDAAIVMIENAHKHLEALAARARRRRAVAPAPTRALGTDRRGRAVEVGPGAVLQPAHHHAVVHPGVRARSAGGAAVRAARVHQDLRDGGRGAACRSRWCRC